MSLRYDPTAKQLGDEIATSELVAQTLVETAQSADDGVPLEAGRTICGEVTESSVHDVVERHPTAVDFRGCASGGMVGLIHTHPNELDRPQHSLPDWANIVYGAADASVIAGTETCDVVVSPTDHTQAQQRFTDAIGYAAQSPTDVVDAIHTEIQNPPAARQRVENQLGALHYEIASPAQDLDIPATLMGASAEHEPVAAAPIVLTDSRHQLIERSQSATSAIRAKAHNAGISAETMAQQSSINISSIIIGTIIGDLVSTGLERTIL